MPIVLKCMHEFHPRCLAPWVQLQDEPTCPYCRAPVVLLARPEWSKKGPCLDTMLIMAHVTVAYDVVPPPLPLEVEGDVDSDATMPLPEEGELNDEVPTGEDFDSDATTIPLDDQYLSDADMVSDVEDEYTAPY